MIQFTKILHTLVFLSIFSLISAQEVSPKYWEMVLSNERSEALKQVQSEYKTKPSITTLISKEIIRNENGQFEPSKDFIKNFLEYADFEPYLYALWNQQFIFNDYLSSGFNQLNSSHINAVLTKGVVNQTLSEALIYLKGVLDRHHNNFTSYRQQMAKMSSITEWQFCGPFENLNNSGLDNVYDPEKKAFSQDDFNANSNGFLNWYNAKQKEEGYMFFGNHNEYGAGVNYAQTFFTNTIERDAVVRIGASSKFKVWLNDVLIYENSKNLNTDLDAYNVKVHLPKGDCRLLIKVAEPSSSSYFIVRITDENGNSLKDIKYGASPNSYKASSDSEINPSKITSYFEQFFLEKIEKNSSDFLSIYCLVSTYMRNQKYEQAKEVLKPLYAKYPNSSIIRRLLISIYSIEEDYNSRREMVKNIELDDPSYYLSLTYRFQDVNELFRMSVDDMNEFLDEFSDATDSDILKISAKMIKSFRIEDKKAVKNNLDKLMDLAYKQKSLSLLKTYAPLYGNVLSNQEKTISILEDLNNQYFDMNVRGQLVSYYLKQNKKDKVLQLYKEEVKYLSNDLVPLKKLIYKLHDFEMYKESLPYIESVLSIYPYSFVGMEYKGDALLQLNKQNEAVNSYRSSLIFNTGNASLRRKIRDITSQPDLIKKYKVGKIYDYVKENRGKITENNYGYNFLLEEVVVELYEEAGGKTRSTILYEITSTNGVESLKEYELGLWGNYSIIKSEIIKPTGLITPAERSGSSFVFNGLEIGDVIHLEYEVDFNGFGRFYKDFTESFQMDSWHPSVLSSYTLIVPNQITIMDTVLNGELEFNLIEEEKYKVYSWKLRNFKGLSAHEDFMPSIEDLARVIHIGTIKSWTQIAQWYSDLVRPQIEITPLVQKTFDEIFANCDLSKMSDEDKAKKIYYYMMNNLTYSFVHFKQSGYVPQKLYKTISSKMGDCKDFSALFLNFAQMAGLEANMVLVLTSDNGRKRLVLPSQEFNHCIVRIMLNGQEQYLELTDKSLPFKSLPNGLRYAQILNIPYTYTVADKFDLISLNDVKRTTELYQSDVYMTVGSYKQNLKITTTLKGAVRSFYAENLDNPNYEMIVDVVKNEFKNVISENMEIDSVYAISIDKEIDSLTFTTEMSINEKINKIGSYMILKVPHVTMEYNGKIISKKERNYPIEYLIYESIDIYKTVYTIDLLEEKTFVEIPENIVLSFKDHFYSRKYEKVSPSRIKITVEARPGGSDISPSEYVAYKSYVSKVLEAKDEFIGIK
jgi:hypothetical protein